MHIIIGIIGISAAIYFWLRHVRKAAIAAGELTDVAHDIRQAALRLGFKHQPDIHPVDSLNDTRITGSAIALAALEIDHRPTEAERNALLVVLQSRMDMDLNEAEDMLVLGRWLIDQCGGAAHAAPRLTRRLKEISGPEILPEMEALLKSVARDTAEVR